MTAHTSIGLIGIIRFPDLWGSMKDEPTGILVLPHFAGAATPYMDAASKGAVVGLTVEHTTSDLYRAMMAGIAVGVFRNLEEAARALIKEKETYYPRKEQHEVYRKQYEKYRNLYQAVRPLV